MKIKPTAFGRLFAAVLLLLALVAAALAGTIRKTLDVKSSAVDRSTSLYTIDRDVFAIAPTPNLFDVQVQDPTTPVDTPPAGAVWSASYLYRVTGPNEDRAAAGAQNRLKTFTNVFGRGWSADLDAFAGMTLRRKVPVAAFLVGLRKPIADQATFYFGTGPIVSQSTPTGWAFGAGIDLRF